MALFSPYHANFPSTPWNKRSLPPYPPPQMPKKQVVLNRFIIFSSLIPPSALWCPFPHPVNIQTLPFIPDFPPTSLLCLYTSFNIMAWHGPLTPLQKTGCLKEEGQFLLLFTLNLILPHSLTQSLQFIPVFSYILSSPMHLTNQSHLLPFSYTFPPQHHPIPQHHLLLLPTMSFPFVTHNFLCAASLLGRHWKWWQQAPLKHWYLHIDYSGITDKWTEIFNTCTVKQGIMTTCIFHTHTHARTHTHTHKDE